MKAVKLSLALAGAIVALAWPSHGQSPAESRFLQKMRGVGGIKEDPARQGELSELANISGGNVRNAAECRERVAKLDAYLDRLLQAGDSDLARAAIESGILLRVDWFQTVAETEEYSVLAALAQEMHAYQHALKLKDSDLFLTATLLFKGLAIDVDLSRRRREANPVTMEFRHRDQAFEAARLKWKEAWDRKDQKTAEKWNKVMRENRIEENLQTGAGLLPTSLKLKSLLGPDTVAIEIVEAPLGGIMSYLGCAVTADASVDPVLLGAATEVEKEVETVRGLMVRDSQPGELTTAACNLHKRGIRPFERLFTGKKRVTFSLDGALLSAPIAFLPGSDDHFLIEKHEVTVCDSFRRFLGCAANRTAKAQQRALLVGDPAFSASETKPTTPAAPAPGQRRFASSRAAAAASGPILDLLPGTREEVKLVNHRLGAQRYEVKELLGDDASEGEVRKALTDWRVVHFATHGLFFEGSEARNWSDSGTSPLSRAAIALAGAEWTLKRLGTPKEAVPNDGLLTAAEICGMNLNRVALAVLSACDTGAGVFVPGDLVLGFRGAFALAGVPNLIVTLVPVADSVCPPVMAGFYERYAASDDISRSWREATLNVLHGILIKDSLDAAIAFLGPFVLVEHVPSSAARSRMGPIRGIIDWRREKYVRDYQGKISNDPDLTVYLTPSFRKRLDALDQHHFGIIPKTARILQVLDEGKEVYVKLYNTESPTCTVVLVDDGTRWLIDDILQ